MFGSLGMPELIFILLLALLVFGPKRLPQVGKTLGKGLREFRRATNDLKRTVETEISTAEMQTPRPGGEASPASPDAEPSSGMKPSRRIDSEGAAAPEPARPADGGADSKAGADVEPAGGG